MGSDRLAWTFTSLTCVTRFTGSQNLITLFVEKIWLETYRKLFSLGPGDLLRREMIQAAVEAANDLWREQQGVEDAVANLNKALSYGTPKVGIFSSIT